MSEQTADQVQAHRRRAQDSMIAFLRDKGWEFKDSTKNALGYWSKRTEGGLWVAMRLDDAFQMEIGL